MTTPTVLAVVAHGGVWIRTVNLGKTFSVRECGIRMFGKNYTAFWGESCR